MSEIAARGQELANAAESFIGIRFRLHGRNPDEGLDCIGLIACCLEVIEENPVAPEGYRLRNTQISSWIGCAELSGFERVSGLVEAGDILLTKPGPGQHHLLIAANAHEAIHAHAGLRRVVRQSLASTGTIHSHWRLR